MSCRAFPGGQDNEGCEIGFKQALAEFPEIKVLAKAPGHWSREPAQKLMADWLVQFPKINAVFSYADTQSLGIYTAMQQAGRTDIKIASANGQIEGLQGVKDGKIAATVFLRIRYWSADGERSALLRSTSWLDTEYGLERMFWLDVSVVDKSNVDQYLSFSKSKPSPYDWKKMSRVLHPNDWENQAPWYPINPVEFWKDRNLRDNRGACQLAPCRCSSRRWTAAPSRGSCRTMRAISASSQSDSRIGVQR